MNRSEIDTPPLPVPRVLGRLAGDRPGPTLLVVAGAHGNEPAGVEGLQRALERLAPLRHLLCGEIVGLAGNLQALAEHRRYLAHDLNRTWIPDRLSRIRAGESVFGAEDREVAELDAELRAVVAGVRVSLFFLDLHTTSGQGAAFGVLDDTLPNRGFALEFPVPLVLGLEEELPGTLMQHLSDQGAVSLAVETGQHDDPASADRAEAVVWIALEAAGVLPAGRPEVTAARRLLAAEQGAAPHVVEVRYRHAIAPEDRFQMKPGFISFQPVAAGQVLGQDRAGRVFAPQPGLLLMPLYQKLGDEGFFLVRPVHPLWLRVSSLLRRLHLERYLHWLPGVRRHPELPESLVVDRRVARWVALEVFHLLGFRRQGRRRARYLVLSRRAYDQDPRRFRRPPSS